MPIPISKEEAAQSETAQYCPLCDRPYDSETTKAASLALVKEHMKDAHPESPEYFED